MKEQTKSHFETLQKEPAHGPLRVAVLLGITALLTACGATTKDNTQITQSSSSRMRNLETNPSAANCQGCVPLVAASESVFQNAIYGLLDSMEIPDLGQVSMNGGAQIGLRIRTDDDSGELIPEMTSLQIWVTDKRAGRPDQPIQIVIDGANIPNGSVEVQGEITGNTLEILFRDPYGEILVEGQINGDRFNGSLSYWNAESQSGRGQPASSSRELQFSIPVLQMIQGI